MNEPTIRNQAETIDAAVLKKLAALRDSNDRALSIYFSQRVGASGNSWRLRTDRFLEEVHRLAHKSPLLSSGSFDSFSKAVLEHSGKFHYFLSVGTETLSGTLPVSMDISRIQMGYRLDLFPLVHALESCKPFMILLFESDRARLFVTRGEAIEELPGALPSVDLKVHADDSRVGWSHHIKGNVAHRSDAYWHELGLQTTNWLNRLHIEDLVIGCRKDLWGHASRQFTALDQRHAVAFFPLRNFEASQHEVLLEARQAFKKLWMAGHSPSEAETSSMRSVTGLEAVLNALQSGAVSTLIMTDDAGEGVVECDGCGRIQSAGLKSCPFCNGLGMHTTLPEALLAAGAILSDAKVMTEEKAQPVRALLRY